MISNHVIGLPIRALLQIGPAHRSGRALLSYPTPALQQAGPRCSRASRSGSAEDHPRSVTHGTDALEPPGIPFGHRTANDRKEDRDEHPGDPGSDGTELRVM